MTNDDFDLAATLETLRKTDRGELDKLLLEAASAGYFAAAVDALLISGAAIDAKDDKGRTPLHLAIIYDHPETAELLIARGAAINVKDRDGWTPLHHAVRCDQSRVVERLIAKGAALNGRTEAHGRTPLHLAGYYGRPAIAELLIAKGARLNKKDGVGQTPLESAHYPEIERLLLDAGARDVRPPRIALARWPAWVRRIRAAVRNLRHG